LQTASTIPTKRVNYLRLLQAASWPELDPREIENIIKSEPSFCYRLLRYLNSATFGFACGIHSVRHALSLLGEDEVRRWLRLVALVGAGQNKTSDLVLSALMRARFCELIAPKIQLGGSDLFLMGLLSLMDAILEIPIGSVLDSVRVDREQRKPC
jgi:EAL and modified HD-GYP domain-containing signal transduction protein